MVDHWEQMDARLCDDDGIVRRGPMHHGVDYQCTGHAHWAGYHITCISPAHQAAVTIGTFLTPDTSVPAVEWRADGSNRFVVDLPLLRIDPDGTHHYGGHATLGGW